MKQTLVLLFLLLSFTWLNAQRPNTPERRSPDKGIILGKIIDAETSGPLDYASVSILQEIDSSLVTGGISDDQGRFGIEVPFGQYIVKIEFISYQTIYLPPVAVAQDQRRVMLGEILLKPASELLEEVEVIAEKSEMQFSLDKRVFNVGKDLANRGGSAEDILDNIPSITVDVEGNVALRGSENVTILVDGKPSGLVGMGDTDGLKSLPSALIERVEVVTNASARYDAEGTAGIINIILKKDRRKGLNGSIDLTAGDPKSYGAALNLNWRQENLNFFLNYGWRDREAIGQGFTNQEFFIEAPAPYTEQDRSFNRGGISHSIRGGLDIFLTERDIITGSILYRIGDDFSDAFTRFSDFDDARNLFQITDRIQDEKEDETNLEYEINYERKFAQKGKKLTASLSFRDNQETESAIYEEDYFDANFAPLDFVLDQRSINSEGQTNTLFQIDFVNPLSKNKKYELGAKASIRDISNNYLIEEETLDGWINLTQFSNNFIYDEDIFALYGIFGNKIGQWSYQLGLRAEYSHVITTLVETQEVNDRDYANLFPTAHITYEMESGDAIQLSYSRRITRPRFWYLNPFFTFANNRNIWGGNPNLDPEFTNSYEIGYIKYWDTFTLGSSLYYRKTTGVIERIARSIGDGLTRTQPENLSTRNSAGLEFTVTADISKKFRMDGSVNVFAFRTRGQVDDQILEAEAFSWNNRMTSRIKFWKDAEAQIRFNYRAPQNTTQGQRKSIYSVDLGVNKDFWNKNATVTLSVRDLFNSRKYRNETLTDAFFMDSEFQRRPRQFTLSLNYRLNQQKKRGRGGRSDGGGNFDGGGEF